MVVAVVLALGVGSGAGAGAPVVSMCPANTETASARLRIVAAHVRSKGFIFVAPEKLAKTLQSSNEASMIGLTVPCQARTDYVRFALALFPCIQSKSGFMTLRASLLRELNNPNFSVDQRAELCCDIARDFENKGEYEEARKVLGSYWRRIGEKPKLSGLEESTAAEVLLRAGVLTGYIGSKHRIEDAQESAKNLISQSQSIFEARKNRKKIAEAQTELALI